MHALLLGDGPMISLLLHIPFLFRLHAASAAIHVNMTLDFLTTVLTVLTGSIDDLH